MNGSDARPGVGPLSLSGLVWTQQQRGTQE